VNGQSGNGQAPGRPSASASAAPRRTPDELQAEVVAAREALLASVAELRKQFVPGALAARGGRAVAGWFTRPEGGIRPERVAIAGAVVVGLVVLTAIGRRRRS